MGDIALDLVEQLVRDKNPSKAKKAKKAKKASKDKSESLQKDAISTDIEKVKVKKTKKVKREHTEHDIPESDKKTKKAKKDSESSDMNDKKVKKAKRSKEEPQDNQSTEEKPNDIKSIQRGNDWSQSQFKDDARQAKFLRLMGAMKPANASLVSRPTTTVSVDNDLMAQFEASKSHSLAARKGKKFGLGL